LKSDLIPDGSNRILHPVVDPVNQPLFGCTIEGGIGEVPFIRFYVDEDAAKAVDLVGPVQAHFARLQLETRYLDQATERVSEFLGQLDVEGVAWGSDAAVTARTLARYGVGDANSWSRLVHEAVADWMDSFGIVSGLSEAGPHDLETDNSEEG